MIENPLLKSSLIFQNSSLIDQLRQIVIDIENEPCLEDVQEFLEESHNYLIKELSYDYASELFSAILTCFKNFPRELVPTVGKFIEKSSTNSNYFLISIFSLAFYSKLEPKIDIPDSQKFICDVIDEINDQNSNQSNKIKIFGHEIDPQFQNDLFLNLELLSNQVNKILLKPINSELVTNSKFNIFLFFSEKKFKKILHQTDSSKVELFEFISQKDDEIIQEFSQESLSIFECAVSYIENESEIEGLTEEIIIPFLAVVSILIQKYKTTFSEHIDMNLLHKSFKESFNKNSQLLITSIDLVLSSWTQLHLNEKIESFKILQELIDNISEYKANKMILIELFLEEIHANKIDHCPQMNSLFEFIMSHINELEFNDFPTNSFNLNLVDKKLKYKLIGDLDSDDFLIEKLYFLQNICINQPSIPKVFKFMDLLIEAQIEEGNFDNVILIFKFMKSNSFERLYPDLRSSQSLPYILKKNLFFDYIVEENEDQAIEELFINILSDECILPDHAFLIDDLFKLLIKDQDNLYNYLAFTVFANINNSQIDMNDYLLKFYYLNKNYHENFLKVTNDYFDFIESKNTLVIRNNFNVESLPVSKFDESIISIIFTVIQKNPLNFQSFLILKIIALTNPKLFDSHVQQIFDLIISKFDNLFLLFKIDTTNDKRKILLAKTAYASLSFTISVFRSPLIFDRFIQWVFPNIEKFSNSQIFGFFYVLLCYEIDDVYDKFITIYIERYDLFSKIVKILERKNNDCFCLMYDIIYRFLIQRFKSIIKCSPFESVQINEYSKNENVFSFIYHNIFSRCPRNKIDSNNKYENIIRSHFDDFINKFDSIKNKFISTEYKKNYMRDEKVQLFSNQLKKENEFVINNDNDEPNKFITIKMAKNLVMKPFWIYEQYLSKKKFIYNKKDGEQYQSIINELTEMLSDTFYRTLTKDDLHIDKLNVNDRFRSLFPQSFINILINQIFQDFNNLKSELFKALMKLSYVSYDQVFEMIHIKNDIQGVLYEISNEKNLDTIGIKLLNFVLAPKNRCNTKILIQAAIHFKNMNAELPIQFTQLIGFLAMTNKKEGILMALKLCQKFNKQDLIMVDEVIKNVFDKLSTNDKQLEYDSHLIMKFIECYPSVFIERKLALCDLLKKEIELYNVDNGYSFIHFEIICFILKNIIPKRNDSVNVSNVIVESTKIPIFLMNSNPAFWSLYEKCIPIINMKLKMNPYLLDNYLEFLLGYPELVDFKVRSSYFRMKMSHRLYRDQLEFDVDFDNLIDSSFQSLENQSPTDLLKRFKINVIGKEVLDYGGVTRQWFTSLSKELFNQNYGLFICPGNHHNYQPSPKSYIQSNHLQLFKFAGSFIARALIEGVCIDAHFTSSFCKKILHRNPCLKDLEDFDEELFNNLTWMYNNDVTCLGLYFETDCNHFGEYKTIPLKENGSNISLTNENKNEYIALKTKFILVDQIKDQIDSFCSGFDELIPHEYLRIFTPSELDLLICGVPTIDFEDFKNNFIFVSPFTSETPVVKLFFEAISHWENDDLAKLLKFITGSSRLPVNGFKEFIEMTGHPLQIAPGGDRDRLPVSHTCFNRLDLPEYETVQELDEKLRIGIQEGGDNFELI